MSQDLARTDKVEITKNPLFVAGILLLSLVPQETGQVVAPIMANIVKAFPKISPTIISYITTLPSLAACIFAIVCGKLSVRTSRKTLALFGLIAYVAGGAGCALFENIYWMLACRFVLGMGAGFCIPLSQGLIAEFYEGDKRASMLGYAQSVGCFGGALISLAAGYVALISWRGTFLLYLFPVIAIVLIALMLPNTTPRAQEEPKSQANEEMPAKGKHNMDFGVYVFSFLGFMNLVLFLGMMINISMVIGDRNLGNSAQAGIALSLMSLTTALASLVFGFVFKAFKVQTMTVSLVLDALTMFLIAKASNIYVIFIATSLWGISTGLFVPCLAMSVSALASKTYKSFALGILNGFSNLGGFAASLAMGLIFALVGASNYAGYFTTQAIVFLVLALGIGIYLLCGTQKKILSNCEEC